MQPAASTVVSSAEFVRQFDRWQDEASARAIVVSHHGRRRLAVISFARYQELLAGAVDGASIQGTDPAIDQILPHLVQGFLAFDAELRITAINPAACAFLKLSPAAAIGSTLADLLPGVDESVGYARLARAARTGETASFEMPSFAFPERWLAVQTFPYRDGAACLFRDVTDDMEARRLADAKTATLAALAAHGDIGRAKLSSRATSVQVDDAFAGLAGFSPSGLLRARLTDILVPSCRHVIGAAVETVLADGAPQACDTRLLARTGEEIDIRLALAPLRGPGGVDGAVVVVSAIR